MKVNIEIDMTPEEARRFMGLPDVTHLNGVFLAEMEKRMKSAMDTMGPDAVAKLWGPLAGGNFADFQQFLWDSARRAAGMGGSSGASSTKKDAPKSGG